MFVLYFVDQPEKTHIALFKDGEIIIKTKVRNEKNLSPN